jgi:SpoVK/Ycf46/Vps4 family AAA+-type ATPase
VFSPLRPSPVIISDLLDLPGAERHVPGAFLVRKQADWNDLVLPADRMQVLREYLLWLKHRDTVVREWGGETTGGPVALFSGPSGTGKTFAAIVVATELGWPLYRVDLATLVSKYIGETEKNLARLFDAAHDQPIVLQFDEVDALMSKRGEIKEARDRYANMEVSYLLARIEEHAGPCILTTNMRNQIDKAFTRRFQVVVEFPRPDQAGREALWQRMLPPNAPLSGDLDMAFLASAVSLTGGNIRNAALHAAYLAAEEGCAIGLAHVAVGVWRELAKDRIQVTHKDLGTLAGKLPSTLVGASHA